MTACRLCLVLLLVAVDLALAGVGVYALIRVTLAYRKAIA